MFDANNLLSEMNRIGVHFLVGDDHPGLAAPLTPAQLLGGLAAQSDARLRLALIAVLLQHPEYAQETPYSLEMLDDTQRLTFKLYYTAAHYLQLVYKNQLQDVLGQFLWLPDKYSEELNIMKGRAAKVQLKRLAKRHQEISGLSLNWYGTYNHAAQRVITRLKVEEAWVTT